MTYDQPHDFVQDYMPRRMQYIYRPFLVGELVASDCSATIGQLAEAAWQRMKAARSSIAKKN